MSQHLQFDTDKGADRSKWVAGALVLVLIGWMGSGFIVPSDGGDTAAPPKAADDLRPVAVAVQDSQAQTITNEFIAEGQAEPKRDTPMRAEAGGTVAEVLVNRGDMVGAGQVIARISAAQREADLTRAQADLERAEREFENAQTLRDRGIATTDRVTQARSALAAAQAGLAAAQEVMGNLEITAPYGGRVEMLSIEPGEVIPTGAEIGRVVDLSPLTVTVQIPQQDIASIHKGQEAEVVFVTGQTRPGIVSFVGASANSETRTFEAEITVENADSAIPAGISARIRIPTDESKAHFLSPAILSLDTDGALGVKAVDQADQVLFYPVEIVRAQTDGVWVIGLPDELTMITIGQGFVNAGETVAPNNTAFATGGQDDERNN